MRGPITAVCLHGGRCTCQDGTIAKLNGALLACCQCTCIATRYAHERARAMYQCGKRAIAMR